jgi:hypothetical protein
VQAKAFSLITNPSTEAKAKCFDIVSKLSQLKGDNSARENLLLLASSIKRFSQLFLDFSLSVFDSPNTI